MAEPLSEARLKLYRRRYENLDEFMQNLKAKENYDPMDIIWECMVVAKAVPKLLDEIDRLKGLTSDA